MQTMLKLDGEHAHLASPEGHAAGINAASEVFARHHVDPLACAGASQKLGLVPIEDAASYSQIGGLGFEEYSNGVADEVILLASMEDDACR